MRMLTGPLRGLRAASPYEDLGIPISMTKPQILAHKTRRMPRDQTTPAASWDSGTKRGTSVGPECGLCVFV